MPVPDLGTFLLLVAVLAIVLAYPLKGPFGRVADAAVIIASVFALGWTFRQTC